jgi:hypothetical protein
VTDDGAPPFATIPLRRWLVVIAVLAVVGIGGIVALLVWEASIVAPTVPVTITPAATATVWAVRVTGTTNLPDGARLSVDLEGANGQLSETVTAAGGKFEASFDATRLGAGRARVTVTFSVGADIDQPVALADRFGPEGQQIGGSQVARTGVNAPPVVHASLSIELPGGESS